MAAIIKSLEDSLTKHSSHLKWKCLCNVMCSFFNTVKNKFVVTRVYLKQWMECELQCYGRKSEETIGTKIEYFYCE
jgi:hypothetical protein